VPYVPFCGIRFVPQIVRDPAVIGPPIKISIKNDRNFFVLGEISIGIPVVKETIDNFALCAAHRERKAVGARAIETP
jgi:hypothetical protein